MTANRSTRRVRDLLAGSWSVGEPTILGAVAVYPVYGPTALHRFVSLTTAMRHGLEARELPARASNDDVWVDNQTPSTTLVFGGEELQSGTELAVCHESWLVQPGRRTWLPICRVGARRSRRSRLASFETTNRIYAPRLRRYEAFLARTRGTPGYGATRSPLPELLDRMLEHEQRVELDEVESTARRFPLHDEQCGALFAVGERFVSFDWVARAEVYRDLHGRLVRGCLTEAMESRPRGKTPPLAEARRWLDLIRDARVMVAESRHAGHSVRPIDASDGRVRVEGAGIAVDGALLQWSAFPADGSAAERS